MKTKYLKLYRLEENKDEIDTMGHEQICLVGIVKAISSLEGK
jgi:hypothetical protein